MNWMHSIPRSTSNMSWRNVHQFRKWNKICEYWHKYIFKLCMSLINNFDIKNIKHYSSIIMTYAHKGTLVSTCIEADVLLPRAIAIFIAIVHQFNFKKLDVGYVERGTVGGRSMHITLTLKEKLPQAFMQIEWTENDLRNLTAKVWANLDNPIKSYDLSKFWLISCMPPSQVALC